MKKILLTLSLMASWGFCQQPVEFTYETVNREFQKELNQLFQDFANQQKAQGNEVVITYYDNFGEPRVSVGTAAAPSYLRAISNYKTKFMRDRQLTSTKGVSYIGGINTLSYPMGS